MLYRHGPATILPPALRPYPVMIPAILPPPRLRRGFTLLELLLVLALVAVLMLLAFQGYGMYIKKGEEAACKIKLINWGVALSSYIVDKGTWPNEEVLYDANGKAPDENTLWDWWYKEMKTVGISHDDWYCPTDLRKRAQEKKADEESGEQDTAVLKNPSYIPGKFGFGPYKAFEYPNQPWVIERAGHDEGINKLMPDGTIQKEYNFKPLGTIRPGGGSKK